ncbi:MAG: hypothetical protein ACYC3I_04225 [Gemmataceae bacterium]
MRALCGAIITAAALIALGLTAQGIGTRYAWVARWQSPSGEETSSPSLKTTPDLEGSHVKIHMMDNGLKLCLTLSILALLIGMGITFVGLMYHHFRRFHEHLRAGPHPGGTPTHHHVTS